MTEGQPHVEEIVIEQRYLGMYPYILIEQRDGGELKFTAKGWASKREIRKVLRMFARRARGR